MSYHVHDPEHGETKIAWGNTFPPNDVEIDNRFLDDWPKLKEALDEIGLQLCKQYAGKNTQHSSLVTGINFVSISFNLGLGPKR